MLGLGVFVSLLLFSGIAKASSYSVLVGGSIKSTNSSFSVAGDNVTKPSHNYTRFQPSYVFPYDISSNGNVVIGNQSTSVSSQNMQPASTNACYANILIGSNFPITTDGTANFPNSETSIVKSGTNIVIAWNDIYDGYSSGSVDGYGYSTDGGKTFIDAGSIPRGNIQALLGDPSLTADTAGNVYYSSLASNTGSLPLFITCSKSTDGGRTFGTPVIAALPPNGFTLDKEMMVADTVPNSPYKNNIYISYTRFNIFFSSSDIEFVRSTDGGNSFSSPLIITNDNASGSIPVLGPGGVVYVAWEDWDNSAIEIAKSTNGGQSFGGPILIGHVTPIGTNTSAYNDCRRAALNGDIRVNDFPSMAIDTSNGSTRGYIYVVWNSQNSSGYSDVLLSRSTDGGSTWSSPIKVNDNTTNTDSFMPWITVSPTGKVTVMWYDRRNDPNNNLLIDVYEAISDNGGLSFEPNIRVTCQSFTPVTHSPYILPCYMGDYNQLTSDLTSDYSAWGDSLTGGQNVYFATTDLSSWTQFHKDAQKDGYGYYGGGVPAVTWSYQTGGKVESSPAIIGDYIFIGSNDGNIYWFNASTGNLLTSWKTNGAVTSSPAVTMTNTGVPIVYVGSQGGKIYALTWFLFPLILWSYQTGGAINSSPAMTGTWNNGTIYIGSSDDYLYALNSYNGHLRWRWSPQLGTWAVTGWTTYCFKILWFQICYKLPIISYVPTPINSSPAVDVANNRVYFTVDRYVYALNTNGNLLWRRTLSSTTSSSPCIDNNMVFVGSDDGTIYGLNGLNGGIVWRYRTGGAIVGTPAVHNGVVYAGAENGEVYMINETTGSYITNTSPAVGAIESSVTLNDVGLGIGSDDGKVYIFSTAGGSAPFSFTTGGPVKSSVAYTQHWLAFGSDDGKVYGGLFTPCSATVAADPAQITNVNSLRKFRDKTMEQGKEGKSMIDMYEKYTSEIAWIIATHSNVKQQAQLLLGEAITVITAYQNKDNDELNKHLTQEQANQLYQFAESIKALTDDQSLKDDLTRWEEDDLSRWQGMPYRAIIKEIEEK